MSLRILRVPTGFLAAPPWRARPRQWLLMLASLLLGLAMLDPAITLPRPAPRSLVVVDITGSMAVRDVGPAGDRRSRLEQVQLLLTGLIDSLPCGPQLGLAVFTERKTLVLMAPLEVCHHRGPLREGVAALDLRMAWAADSHLYYGVYSGLDQLRQRWPGTQLAFFSDGHQAPPLFPGREPGYDAGADRPGGVLFAVGGDIPQPVPRFDAEGRLSGYWSAEDAAGFASTGAATLSVRDMEQMAGSDKRNAGQRPAGAGDEHLSARREAVLEDIARRTGLTVARADEVLALRRILEAQAGVRWHKQRVPLHDPLLVLALLLSLAGVAPALPRRRARATPSPASRHSSAP